MRKHRRRHRRTHKRRFYKRRYTSEATAAMDVQRQDTEGPQLWRPKAIREQVRRKEQGKKKKQESRSSSKEPSCTNPITHAVCHLTQGTGRD